jgi:hypothetical protein
MGGIIKDGEAGNHFYGQVAQLFLGNFDIRHNAPAVKHLSSIPGGKSRNQGVGHGTHAAVLIPVRVVERLDTSSAGNIIFCRGHL